MTAAGQELGAGEGGGDRSRKTVVVGAGAGGCVAQVVAAGAVAHPEPQQSSTVCSARPF